MYDGRRRSRPEIGHLHETDAELLRRAQRGDDEAFHQLVDRHAGGLFKLAFALVGNAADAEDVMQETFLGALKTIRGFERRSSVKTWLCRILSKRAARCHRARRRHAAVPMENDTEPSATSETKGVPTSDAVDARLDMTEMIGALSAEHREVVVLRELEGMSYAEIAEVLNVPIGTVESRLYRARQELRSRLEGYLT